MFKGQERSYISYPVGHCHMSVDIKCPSIDNLFTQILHPMTPLFSSVHTQWLPFFHFSIKFYIQIAKVSRALRAFWEIHKFGGNFNIELANVGWKLNFFILNAFLMTLIFESRHIKGKKIVFFFFFFFFFWSLHRMTPLFQRNLILNPLYFRSPVSTYASLSYLSAPRLTIHLMRFVCGRYLWKHVL